MKIGRWSEESLGCLKYFEKLCMEKATVFSLLMISSCVVWAFKVRKELVDLSQFIEMTQSFPSASDDVSNALF